jgi:phage baseplate assembly protein W|tara:strand:+ start:131 stop:541 length:411 start_codon:yes stop_codon:yes gene_type:complete
MAYDVKRIDPLDLQPRKAIGVSLPFSGKAVFNSTYQSKDAIKANLINLLLTGTGERFLNPFLGTGLRTFLFENINEGLVRTMKSEITSVISTYFPRILIRDLSITGEPSNNSVTVFLKYQVSETDIDDEIIINIEQ